MELDLPLGGCLRWFLSSFFFQNGANSVRLAKQTTIVVCVRDSPHALFIVFFFFHFNFADTQFVALPYGNVHHMPLYIIQCTVARRNHADIFNSMLVTASKDR